MIPGYTGEATRTNTEKSASIVGKISEIRIVLLWQESFKAWRPDRKLSSPYPEKGRIVNTCKQILVVEDNDDIREAISEALELEGFSVETARNGKEGLAMLRKTTSPTLVLLDLMMPVMNGWEFLDAQKNDPQLREHRVITISAVDSSISVEDPSPLLTDGAIRKPLSLESIWAEVRKHCRPQDLSAA